MSWEELAVGAESQGAALPKQSWTVFQQSARAAQTCLALSSPYVWLQSRTLAVSGRWDLFRCASAPSDLRGKAGRSWQHERQLSAQPSWGRRATSVREEEGEREGSEIRQKGAEIPKCGRQTDPGPPRTDRRWTTAILRLLNWAREEDKAGRGRRARWRGSEGRDEMTLTGKSQCDAG